MGLRDSGQLGLAQAIATAASPPWLADLEHPIASGDPRAADLLITHPLELVQVEVERSLVDFQAQLRAAQLKRAVLAAQHQRPLRLVIAVPDSSASRLRLAPYRPLLAQALPISSRAIWASLRSGRPIGGDGLLYVRPDRAARPRGRG